MAVRLWLVLSLGLLVAADVQSCEAELGKVLQRFLTILPNDTYSKMASYSGKWIGDLGNYFDCIEMAQADYALFSLKIDGTSLYYSLCGPANCTADDYMQLLSGDVQSPQVQRLSQELRNSRPGLVKSKQPLR